MPDPKAEKPYTFEELKTAMAERNWAEDALEEIRRNIRVEEAKLESLRRDEAEKTKKLEAEERKVLKISNSIHKDRNP